MNKSYAMRNYGYNKSLTKVVYLNKLYINDSEYKTKHFL